MILVLSFYMWHANPGTMPYKTSDTEVNQGCIFIGQIKNHHVLLG